MRKPSHYLTCRGFSTATASFLHMFTLWLFNSMTAFTCWFQKVLSQTNNTKKVLTGFIDQGYLSIYLSIYLYSIYLSIYLSIIYLYSIYLSIYLYSIYLSIYNLSIYSRVLCIKKSLLFCSSISDGENILFLLIKPGFYFRVLLQYCFILSWLVCCDFWVDNKLVPLSGVCMMLGSLASSLCAWGPVGRVC